MRFVVDAQLPPALARWLGDQGHDAVHVKDLDLAEATDSAIWDHAVGTSAVIISKDEDFAVRVQREGGSAGPAVIWARLGNTRTRSLLERCAPLWPAAIEALDRGERLVEIA